MALENLYFRDPVSLTVYTVDNKFAFGEILPNTSSVLKEIEVVNKTGITVSDIVVNKSGETEHATLKISAGNDPEPIVPERTPDSIRNGGLPWYEYVENGNLASQYVVVFDTSAGFLYKNSSGYIVCSGSAKRYSINQTTGALGTGATMTNGSAVTSSTNFNMLDSSDNVYTTNTKTAIYIKQPKYFRPVATVKLGTLLNDESRKFYTKMSLSSQAIAGSSGEVVLTVSGTEGV